MRDYDCIVKRVEALDGPDVAIETLGEANGYPTFCVRLSRDASLPTIYINGGTHGDEPAGVEGALAFLEGDWARWSDHVQFCVVPCLNPWGYVHNKRENADGVDINWAWQKEGVPEVQMVKKLIDGKKFVATVDLHEDWESPGFYVYELFRGCSVGQAITERVADVCPLNTDSVIEGEQAVNGLIHPNLEAQKRRVDDGIPVVLFRYGYTQRLVTTETPTGEVLATRVAAQLAVLDVVIGAQAHA